MAFINKTTGFGTTSLFSQNGTLIGSSTPSTFNLGTVYHQPFQSMPNHREIETQSGSSVHLDSNGGFRGISYKDQLGNSHFSGTDGQFRNTINTTSGANVYENGSLVKRFVGNSTDANQLAESFSQGALNLSDDLVDVIW